VSSVVAIALADARQRVRTFATLLIVAFALQIGYLFVPDANAPYVTVDLDGWRGLYDSNWMGAATALLIVTLYPLAGFFLVRPAMKRDAALGTLDLLLSAPLSRVKIVLGKWLSDVAVLAGVGAITMLAAMAMQVVRAENLSIDPGAYLLPYLIVVLPACAVTAALSVAFSAIPGMDGIFGGVVWFFIWSALLIAGIGPSDGTNLSGIDAFGITSITSSFYASLQAHVGASVHLRHEAAIGVSPSEHLRTFPFTGIEWSPALVTYRAAWCGAAVLLCAAVAPFTFRTPARAPRTLAPLMTRFIAGLPLPRLLRADLAQGAVLAGTWWTLGVLALTLAGTVAAGVFAERGVAPLAWVWPIGTIASLSVIDVRTGLEGVLAATPIPPWRRILSRWLAAFCLAALPIVALALHAGAGSIALVAIAAALAAVGISLGAIFRNATAFESAALIAWYLGPVNRVAALDPAQAAHFPLVTSSLAVAATLAALGAATYRLHSAPSS
jgi:ABC-type transport system involved in multi-copper enzyme maturation permease subunit